MIRWKTPALSLIVYKNVAFETRLQVFKVVESKLYFINGFTRTAFMDVEDTRAYNYLLTIFVIGLIRTPRDSFTSHIYIDSAAE